MNKRLILFTLLLSLTIPAHADFRAVARAIDAHRAFDRVWLPFLGVARAAVWLVQPKGVADFQLVLFRSDEGVDAREMQQILRSRVGAGFTPLVQVRSRRDEWSFIYARPSDDGKHVELIVLAHDDEETVLVRVHVDPTELARHIKDEPRRVSHVARR